MLIYFWKLFTGEKQLQIDCCCEQTSLFCHWSIFFGLFSAVIGCLKTRLFNKLLQRNRQHYPSKCDKKCVFLTKTHRLIPPRPLFFSLDSTTWPTWAPGITHGLWPYPATLLPPPVPAHAHSPAFRAIFQGLWNSNALTLYHCVIYCFWIVMVPTCAKQIMLAVVHIIPCMVWSR